MKVSDLIDQLEMTPWHKFVFYAVNIPRYLARKKLIVLPCMYKGDGLDTLKKIQAGFGDKNGQADA